jgi:transcriptional regulator with XRE-family HTH domain
MKPRTLGFRLAQERREKAAREERDIEQNEIAKAAGVTQGSYSRYEADATKPDDETMKKLAAYFGVDPGWLRFGTGQKHPSPAEVRIPDPTKAAVPASGVKKRAGGR